MKQSCSKFSCIFSSLAVCLCIACQAWCQNETPDTTREATTVVAGPQYNRSAFYQRLWGKHYRKEWNTPVTFQNIYLDTAMGGLVPYKAGGSNQTKTLRLRNADGKEYVLRSIDKSYAPAIPEIYKGTFIENIVNDQASSMHPYAAVTIPSLSSTAGVYHTQPMIRFLPKQAALDSFNEAYGNKLYLLEQRPDENWEEASNFGNSENIISTENLLGKLLKDPDIRVDQQLYVRSRLFDMFIGDWSRREDQWRWAAITTDEKTVYQPVPRDRDQAYAKFDGVLLRILLSSAGLGHLESFSEDIGDVTIFNFSARNLDRRMANECDMQVWVNTAKELQQALTDEVIETSIKQLPPEVYPISGERIIQKLKSRRGRLVEFAKQYSRFLAKEVDIPGTEKSEHFEITRVNETSVKVSVYKLNEDGGRVAAPFYERTFNSNVTKEIRVYGIAGNDSYQVNGREKNDIDVVIIGGKDRDVITDASGAMNKVKVYDDPDNIITSGPRTKLRLSNDDAVHAYRYDAFVHDKKGFKPAVFFSNYDRFYIGLGYEITKQGWRKEPFAYQHGLYARYSINQNAVSVEYEGTLNQSIGNWDLLFNAYYDAVRWTNYFGIGNETIQLPEKEIEYYRVRTREIYGSISLNRRLGPTSYLRFTPFYQGTKILRNESRFLQENIHSPFIDSKDDVTYKRDDYAGITMSYLYAHVDDAVVPTKGITFTTALSHIRSLENNRAMNSYAGGFNFYIPVSRRLVLSSRNGFATLTGEPKFYQLNTIGGSLTLRGYRRDRFRGTTAFSTNNELQWLFNVKSNLFNGVAGPVVFYDIGRVWQSGEDSKQWHSGCGAGIVVAPFNRAMISVGYGISKENRVVHVRLSRAF